MWNKPKNIDIQKCKWLAKYTYAHESGRTEKCL